ncbi:MAG: hypothetical protein CMA60_05850 [Euryarchaeota archaeon]|nr:hypothetical protein [Euryarchaeota archaeon]|tara:strand:- start:385 stop:576 length:192 start_codon:yes stop_codon:yes gene_type:complete
MEIQVVFEFGYGELQELVSCLKLIRELKIEDAGDNSIEREMVKRISMLEEKFAEALSKNSFQD